MNNVSNNRTLKLSAKVGKDHSLHKTIYGFLKSTRERMEGNKERGLYDCSK
jgi:hypothetical protein